MGLLLLGLFLGRWTQMGLLLLGLVLGQTSANIVRCGHRHGLTTFGP